MGDTFLLEAGGSKTPVRGGAEDRRGVRRGEGRRVRVIVPGKFVEILCQSM